MEKPRQNRANASKIRGRWVLSGQQSAGGTTVAFEPTARNSGGPAMVAWQERTVSLPEFPA
jgi:hypothetical protein